MTEEQVKELVKSKREELSSLLPETIKKKTEFYIDKIFSLLSFETRPMAIDFLIDFYKFVYDLPASSEKEYFGVHHQREFGLFLHSLEVCWETLKRTKEKTFIKQKDGVFFSGSYYTTKPALEYVFFLSSLCHDIGKVLTYKIVNKTTREDFKPFLISLYDFKKQVGETAELEIEFSSYKHKHFTLLSFCIFAKSDLNFLTEPKPTQGYSLDALEYLFDVLSGRGETEFGRDILDIIHEADAISAIENIKEEEPQYVLIQQFLQRKYAEYYEKGLLLKGEKYTAFSFPFIIKEIMRNVLHIRIEIEERIPDAILGKIISLLEEYIVFSDEKNYIFLLKPKQKARQRKAVLIKNDFLGSAPTPFQETLSKWQVIKLNKETEEETEILFLPEEKETTTPLTEEGEKQNEGQEEQKEELKPVEISEKTEEVKETPEIKEITEAKEIPEEIKETPEEKMYNYFKNLPIVKYSSVEEIRGNSNNKRVAVFKNMQTKFPAFDSTILTSFLERIEREEGGGKEEKVEEGKEVKTEQKRETEIEEIIEEVEQGEQNGEGDIS